MGRESHSTDASTRVGSPRSQLPVGEVLVLTDLVAYADGSIVSRTLLSNDAGTLTLFAFDVDQALSEHSTPFNALVQILDGQAELTIGGRVVPAGQGDLVLMPANVPHAVRASQRFKMLLTMLKAETRRRGPLEVEEGGD